MIKVSNAFISAFLALFSCIGLVSCAHGHSLVFGPELFSGEGGKTQRVVKRFSVEDISQKFFISMQGRIGSQRKPGNGAININGKPVFLFDETGERYKMLTKPIELQQQNEISVEVSGETVVTIMSLKEIGRAHV